GALERVEDEWQRIRHHAVLAQEFDPRTEVARMLVPDDDPDRAEIDGRQLEPVSLAQGPYVGQPIDARDRPRGIARIPEHARRTHPIESPAVLLDVVEPLCAAQRI